MTNLIRKFFHQGLLTLLIFLPAMLAAQQPPAAPQQPATDPGSSVPQQNAAQNNQSISQSGLLPVYGVDMRVDPAWVDSSQFPSQSPNFQNSGTSAAFQQVWGALQPGGYNAMRVPVDVRDAAGATNRAANLCLWAKNNNVQLILLLAGSDAGQRIGQDFPTQVSNFVQSLVTLMRSNNGQYLANYSQIMAYQIEDELNHAGRHGGMTASAAQQRVLQAAQALRKAETDALNGSGLAATPLMASTSFDFELIKAGAIAGGTLTDAAYNQAYQSLKQVLVGLAGSPNLDLLSVDWFAGSVGGGGVEKAPQLLRSLIADVTGKQLVLTTGFSTAFRSADEQKRLYAMAFANLSDLRASAGADCPFVGTIFREALNGNNANPNPPRPTLPGEMDKWDWKAKAAELAAMWTQSKNSDDMSWWLAKVENNMGLVTLQNDASGNVAVNPLPAQQGMTQIASTVSDVNASMAANPATNPAMNFNGQPTNSSGNPSTDPNANSYGQQQPPGANPYANPAVDANGQPIAQPAQPGTSGTGSTPSAFMMGLQGSVQKGMLGLLDGVFQRLATMSTPGGGQGFNNANNAAAQYNNNAYNNNPGQQPGNPYNYYNNPGTQPGGQPATNYGAQPGQQGYPGGQPGGATPGAVQLGPQDVSLQPMNPQVGSPVTINVNLQNIGGSDVYGLMVMAVGDDNVTLGQMNSVHIAPNSSTPVTLQWFPAVAKPSYQITVNVGDGSGNQLASAPLSPIAVTAMQAPNNPGNGAAGSGNPGGAGADPSGGASPAGGTGAAGSGVGVSGNNPPAGSQLLPGGTADMGGAGTSSAPGGTLSAVTPMGAVKVDGVQVGNGSQGPSSGQQTPVVVAVSNPYLVPLSNIKATLLVDGKAVQTQTMGALLPQQNRSLLFQGVNFPQAGQHEVKVTVDSQRPGAQPQTGTATQQIVVPAGTTTVAGGNSAGGATGTGGTAAGATGGAAGGANSPTQGTPGTAVGTTGKVRLGPSMKPPVRSVMPPSFQVGQVVVPTGTGPSGASGATGTPIVGMPPVKPGTTGGTPNAGATGATAITPPTGALKSGATGTTGATGTAIVGMPPVRPGTTPGTPSTGATGATSATPPTGAPLKSGATGTTGAAGTPTVGMPPVRPSTTGGTTNVGAAGATPTPHLDAQVKPGAAGSTGATGVAPTPPTGAPVRSIGGGGATTLTSPNTGLPPQPGAPVTTGTTGAASTPPTGAPVRSIGGGGTTTPTPPNTGLPPRPGTPVTTGATGATPTPPTGAPVRSIGGGGATTPTTPTTVLPPRPGAPVTTGATGVAPTPPTGAPVRSIGGGGATTPTTPTTVLPPRPGAPVTTGITQTPPTGAPVRPGPSGTTTTVLPPRPGAPVTTGITQTPPTGAPVRPGPVGTTVAPPPSTSLPARPGATGGPGTPGATSVPRGTTPPTTTTTPKTLVVNILGQGSLAGGKVWVIVRAQDAATGAAVKGTVTINGTAGQTEQKITFSQCGGASGAGANKQPQARPCQGTVTVPGYPTAKFQI
jgi:hypothetical protein